MIPNLIKTFSDRTELYGSISYLFLINGGQTLKSKHLWKEALPGPGCLDFFAQDTARDRYAHSAVSRHLLCSCELPSPSWSGFEFSMWLSLHDSDSLYSSCGFYILFTKSCKMTGNQSFWGKWLKWWHEFGILKEVPLGGQTGFALAVISFERKSRICMLSCSLWFHFLA